MELFDKKFVYFTIPVDGETQLANMTRALITNQDKKYKEDVKYFVARLYEYIYKGVEE